LEKEHYFLRFFDEVAADPNTLFSLHKPPPEGCGEVIGDDGSDDPFPGDLQAVLVQGGPRQGSPEEEEVGWCEIRQMDGCSNTCIPFTAIHSFKLVAVWTGALSQWNLHCCWAMVGIFFLKCSRKVTRTLMVYAALIEVPQGAICV
jgi:hypothetical protein